MLRPLKKDYYAQLENTIGWQEMEAFVCEDQDDANLLMRKLRQDVNLHRINVICSNPDVNVTFNHPSNLPKHVKKVFLDEVLGECPKAIKNHLCQKKKLHMVPVFHQDPGDSIKVTKYFVELCR